MALALAGGAILRGRVSSAPPVAAAGGHVNPLFALDRVSYRYLEEAAVQQICLQIGQGDRIALLGANGSGKSTLLNLLAGLLPASEGELRFRGELLNPENLALASFAHPFRKLVQLVFQEADYQLFNATVAEELAFGPLQMGLSHPEVEARVQAALALLDIQQLKERSPHRLSGGEKKRVALAAVLAIEPQVLLLDEPTAALDPRTAGHIVRKLGELAAEMTLVTATHDLHYLHTLATRCLVMEEGRIVADGDPEHILADKELLARTNLVASGSGLCPVCLNPLS